MNLNNVIEKVGKENIFILVGLSPLHKITTDVIEMSYTTFSDDLIQIPCKIIEERYKLKDNYKIELQSLYNGFKNPTFYISDLQSMIDDGHAQILFTQSIINRYNDILNKVSEFFEEKQDFSDLECFVIDPEIGHEFTKEFRIRSNIRDLIIT